MKLNQKYTFDEIKRILDHGVLLAYTDFNVEFKFIPILVVSNYERLLSRVLN